MRFSTRGDPNRPEQRGTMRDQTDDQNGNLTRVAYARISSAIVDGRLDLGEPLSEIELANALGMSKSPVRNAIKELQVRGLVEIVPQSGTYVFSPTEAQIIEISEFRTMLEEQGLLLAMERNREALLAELDGVVAEMRALWAAGTPHEMKKADARFHQALIRHAGNAYLASAYADVSLLVEALRYRFMDTAHYRNRAYEEHLQMLEILRKDQVTKAVKLLRAHVERTKEFQSRASWSSGRASRRIYRARDYANILAAE
jgi:DNA-binding GntR family transcriptional regulator